MKTHDFLLELGTEELPPKLLLKLSNTLKDNFDQELNKLNLSFNNIKAFATPRRLAISISELQSKQQDQVIDKKGPSTQSPEMAINGFAKSCGVTVDELEKKELGGKATYLNPLESSMRAAFLYLAPSFCQSSMILALSAEGSAEYNLEVCFIK